MKKLFVISKNSTTNLGNVALTSELISLFLKEANQSSLIFAGRPMGLNYIDFDELNQSSNPNEIFNRWVRRLTEASKDVIVCWDERSSLREVKYISNVNAFNTRKVVGRIKRVLKQLILPKISSAYKLRLRTILDADVVIYSGAGEVCDDVVLLRQLVELSLMQKKGIKTFAINQSINLRNSKVIKVFKEVYSKMEGIVVRGNYSRNILLDIGIPENVISVCPDTAILTTPTNISPLTNAIGINFTPYTHFSVEGMRKLIEYLRSRGYQILFVTNDRHSDKCIIEQFEREFEVHTTDGQTDHQNFCGSLAKFKFVISSRLHTNVMALAAGVPVLPIEGHFFKTTEMFDLFKYPIPVVDKNRSGWESELIERVKVLESTLVDNKKYIEDNLSDWREMAKGNYFLISKLIED